MNRKKALVPVETPSVVLRPDSLAETVERVTGHGLAVASSGLMDPIEAELAEADRARLAGPRRRLTADDLDRLVR